MTTNKPLHEREESVLSSVIHHYVATAKPVGSQLIADEMEVSSATIRHVLVDLENKGLLTHPHTSAGRVPMDQGYRFYVDKLMTAKRLNLKEKNRIEREYQRTRDEVDTLLRHTAKILSAMTRLAGLAVFHVPQEISLDHFQIAAIDSRKILVVLALGEGLAKEELVWLDEPVQLAEITRITQMLNSRFAGKSLAQIRESLLKEAETLKKNKLSIIETALKLIEGALRFSADQVHLEGASYLTEQPEFHNFQMMEQVVRLVEERQPLAQVLGRQWVKPGLAVEIGREFQQSFLRNFSFVHVPYYFQGQVVGALGVLGPTRMAYDRVAGVVGHMARQLETALAHREG
ncbi:MAG TPA: heat-inducible transcriptional repressor HrcA [bacterium]|nr:heat-inducible transcriptional repressor HrcA [bacterium]